MNYQNSLKLSIKKTTFFQKYRESLKKITEQINMKSSRKLKQIPLLNTKSEVMSQAQSIPNSYINYTIKQKQQKQQNKLDRNKIQQKKYEFDKIKYKAIFKRPKQQQTHLKYLTNLNKTTFQKQQNVFQSKIKDKKQQITQHVQQTSIILQEKKQISSQLNEQKQLKIQLQKIKSSISNTIISLSSKRSQIQQLKYILQEQKSKQQQYISIQQTVYNLQNDIQNQNVSHSIKLQQLIQIKQQIMYKEQEITKNIQQLTLERNNLEKKLLLSQQKQSVHQITSNIRQYRQSIRNIEIQIQKVKKRIISDDQVFQRGKKQYQKFKDLFIKLTLGNTIAQAQDLIKLNKQNNEGLQLKKKQQLLKQKQIQRTLKKKLNQQTQKALQNKQKLIKDLQKQLHILSIQQKVNIFKQGQ